MTVRSASIEASTRGDNDVIDLTGDVARIVDDAGVSDGIAVVFVPGSTAGITTIEMEPGMVADLQRHLNETVPQDAPYRHNHGGDANGHAHVRAAMIGPSVAVPFQGGRLMLGTWQQIVLVDCDDRPRRRTVLVQIAGE